MNIVSKKLMLLFAATLPCLAYGKTITPDYNLIPQPRNITVTGKKNVLPADTVPAVSFDAPATWAPEQYRLTITPKGITITAASEQAAIWAKRTLCQLRQPDGRYPQVKIEDFPEFPIRGFMHDDGRNFAGVDIIKEYIDLMSAYKLNVFQWHLTDKPAWRIESKCYPQLNDGKFQRPGRDQGCYYTYDQIRDVIKYAKDRGITVIPELDMPGHSDFFQTTFGFSMDSPKGMAVLEKCIDEFCNEIPADMCPYIHIGSDEVRVKDPEGFMAWAQKTVRSHGRKTLAWNPGLPIDSLTIGQFWREGSPEKVTYPSGVPFVDSGMGYTNNYDPLLLPFKMFFHAPCGNGIADQYALGGILCMWNDVRAADKKLMAMHNGLAGNMLVHSERMWNGGQTTEQWMGAVVPAPESKAMQKFETFQKRMLNHKHRFLPEQMSYWEPLHASQWQITMTGKDIDTTFVAYGDVLDLNSLCTLHNIPGDIELECKASREIMSPTDTVRYFKIGFDMPSRSNRKSDGIPAQGHWPNFGSITVNGSSVAPQQWNEPETYRFHYNTWARLEEELPYTDEQLYWMCKPSAISLKKGVNRIEMKLRRQFPGQPFHMAFIEAECQ